MRAADDVADSPVLAPDESLRVSTGWRMRFAAAPAIRAPRRSAAPCATRVCRRFTPWISSARFVSTSTKQRYADVAELIDYCRLSAMPVGRFVLDVHGEAKSLWPASDALCAALQVINHLQDCADDYRKLDRVYLSATDSWRPMARRSRCSAAPALAAAIARRRSSSLPNILPLSLTRGER